MHIALIEREYTGACVEFELRFISDATSYHGSTFQLRPPIEPHVLQACRVNSRDGYQSDCKQQQQCHFLEMALDSVPHCHSNRPGSSLEVSASDTFCAGPRGLRSAKASKLSGRSVGVRPASQVYLLLTKPCMEGDCNPAAASDSLQVELLSRARSGTFCANAWLRHQRTQDP